ncbi:unnamed protein product [Orchesella dallaii]|uniref:Uncharacterized protein n=1 Tax=Orchesella dallaii TaxID=48710 RepID=A0ABP1S4K2_9HEXA
MNSNGLNSVSVNLSQTTDKKILKTGNGKVTLYRMPCLADENGMCLTIQSSKNSFPLNDQGFMTSLKRELQQDFRVNLPAHDVAEVRLGKSVNDLNAMLGLRKEFRRFQKLDTAMGKLILVLILVVLVIFMIGIAFWFL